MKKFIFCLRTVFALILSVWAVASCNNEDEAIIDKQGQVMAVIYDNAELVDNDADTKAGPKTTWTNGDAIGVFCVEPGKQLGKVNFASNKKYVYEGGKFKPATEADKIWISREGAFKFYAYFPYSTAQTGENVDARALEFSVAADQSSETNRINSDIMAAQSTTVDGVSGEVDMDFYHMMSDVRFGWTRSDANSKEYVKALFPTGAVVNLADLTCIQKAGQGAGSGIQMNVKTALDPSTGLTEFQAYVPPVTLTNGQDLFVPYDASGKPLAPVKASLGTERKNLERGKTYDLAGSMFTITADVRKNGDMLASGCDKYDGCELHPTGGGDSGTAMKFVGRYLSGRECQVAAQIGSGLPAGTQFIGWFEFNNISQTWEKIADAGETYRFVVNKSRRLQARYESYVYSPWKITWEAPVTGDNVPVLNIAADDASFRSVVLSATRTVTLDGVKVDDAAMTTRNNNQITLKVQENEYLPANNTDRFGESAWAYTESSKTIKSTANVDEQNGQTVARKMVAHVVIDGQDMYATANGAGAHDNPIDHAQVPQSAYMLIVNQTKGSVTYGDNNDNLWSVLIENEASVNRSMEAKGTVNGATLGSFDVFIYRPKKISGVTVDIETVVHDQMQKSLVDNTDSHWGISSTAKTRVFPAAKYGHDFANKAGATMSVTTKNNKTLSQRTQHVTVSSSLSGNASKSTTLVQNAGQKTNKVYTDYVITGTATPTTLTANASIGTENTSVISNLAASRTVNYCWNSVTADSGSENETATPTLTLTQGSAFASLSNGRVSVTKNYDESNPSATSDRTIVVTATIANTENGHAASTHNMTIVQKGATFTYGNYRIVAEPASMEWEANDAAAAYAKTFTVTGYRTKYLNGVSQGDEIQTVSNVAADCTEGFKVNIGTTYRIWPIAVSDGPEKTGTATITATCGGTSCTTTITLKQKAQEWWVKPIEPEGKN
ncbi:fimbrillin family protein [Parabacteroides merdae]|uniref:fimbrillin family protein n=3 Tax=Parabacteroides merdae TaxID=46503 RepID=UPI0034A29443